MASPTVIQITPVTLTELTIIVESTNGIEVKTLADCNITLRAITLTLPRPPYGNVNLKFYSQGYNVGILENVSGIGNSIELTPTSDYIKTSDGTNNYYVKDSYSRQFGNDLLDIVMTKADSSDIPTAISDLTDDTSTTPIDKAKSVKDQRDSSSLKYWTGTKAQYDAIVTKDSDTIYNVEDTTSPIVDILNTLYQIGAIYIGTMATCPLSVLGVGTWQLVAQDRVLQGAGTRGAVGDTVEAGLPNITAIWQRGSNTENTTSDGGSCSGGFYQAGTSGSQKAIGNSSAAYAGTLQLGFDASLSNPIYGNSTTVQPPTYLVNIWERIS